MVDQGRIYKVRLSDLYLEPMGIVLMAFDYETRSDPADKTYELKY